MYIDILKVFLFNDAVNVCYCIVSLVDEYEYGALVEWYWTQASAVTDWSLTTSALRHPDIDVHWLFYHVFMTKILNQKYAWKK